MAYEPLQQNITTNVLVIGGVISGLTTAYCVAKEGLKVVLVKDGYLAVAKIYICMSSARCNFSIECR
jgi:heterodisulfide reductase subunit A-like polyferredoxin